MNIEVEGNFKVYNTELGDGVGRALATTYAKSCPASLELDMALTKLEESMMWANAAIARNE